MKPACEVIEVNLEELEALLERKRGALGEEDYQKLKKGLRALSYLTERIGDQEPTISQLRALLVKPSKRRARCSNRRDSKRTKEKPPPAHREQPGRAEARARTE